MGNNIKPQQFAWTNIILLIVIIVASLGIFSPSKRSFALLSIIQDRWNWIAHSVPLWNITDLTLLLLGKTPSSNESKSLLEQRLVLLWSLF